MLPLFDLRSILISSIQENRILLSIPWIVQYLIMLDHVALQLKYYKDLLQILYEIYIIIEIRPSFYRPTTKFIIRLCLGWLFDQLGFNDLFYTYRQQRISMPENQNFIKTLLWSSFNSNEKHSFSDSELRNFPSRSDDCFEFNANLEEILTIACPFLADFRVSIMPSKLSKTVSRSGKYRYITTKLAENNTCTNEKPTDAQSNLLGEFLQSQSQSTRKTIDYVIERTASAVVKDFQMEHFIPIKEAVIRDVSLITEKKYFGIKKELLIIYKSGLDKINKIWNSQIYEKIKLRTAQALNALLPNETLPLLKDILIKYSIKKSSYKSNEWKQTHCSGIEIFTQDIDADVDKILRNINVVKNDDYLLKLNINGSLPSQTFSNMQYKIFDITNIEKEISFHKIIQTIEDLHNCIHQHELSKTTTKIAALQLIELAVFLICYRGKELQETDNLSHVSEFYTKFINFFIQPNLKEFITIPESKIKHDNDIEPPSGLKIIEEKISNMYIFQNFFNARLIFMIKLNGCGKDSWMALQKFLVTLINSNLMSLCNLNDQCLLALKQDFDEDIMQNISNLMSCIFDETLGDQMTNEKLVTQVLSNLMRDIDF